MSGRKIIKGLNEAIDWNRGRSRTKIDLKLAKKIVRLVDKGLPAGLGQPKPGKMCVEAVVCYALGEDHGDEPSCVDPSLSNTKIDLNDDPRWSSKQSRARGLRRLAIAQLGSRGKFNDGDFWDHVTECLFEIEKDQLLDRLSRATRRDDLNLVTHNKDYYTHENVVGFFHGLNRTLSHNACLHLAAEVMVQALIRMKIPGTKFLHLVPYKGAPK